MVVIFNKIIIIFQRGGQSKNHAKLTAFSAEFIVTFVFRLFVLQKSFSVPNDHTFRIFALVKLVANIIFQMAQIAIHIVKCFIAILTLLARNTKYIVFSAWETSSIT